MVNGWQNGIPGKTRRDRKGERKTRRDRKGDKIMVSTDVGETVQALHFNACR